MAVCKMKLYTWPLLAVLLSIFVGCTKQVPESGGIEVKNSSGATTVFFPEYSPDLLRNNY